MTAITSQISRSAIKKGGHFERYCTAFARNPITAGSTPSIGNTHNDANIVGEVLHDDFAAIGCSRVL
jgi:hypothetical protein